MKRLFTILSAGFTYFCVATVISLAAILTGLWFKGALDQERVTRVLAALHGIDVVTMHQQLVAQQAAANTESISRSERLEQQKLQNLDLDMREAAIANALAEMRTIQTKLELETNRFEDLKKAYARTCKNLLMKNRQRHCENCNARSKRSSQIRPRNRYSKCSTIMPWMTSSPSSRACRLINARSSLANFNREVKLTRS